MIKKVIFAFIALFFTACAANNNIIAKVNQISNDQKCYSCDSAQGYEAKINGLLYVSDIGIRCCANKRTLDSSIALKKVYLHRFYDLEENKKILIANDSKKYFINEKFNAIFYIFLEQELKNRGIVIINDEAKMTPYVLKVDLSFIDFKSILNGDGLHSKVAGVLKIKDVNMNKSFTIRTTQDVVGFNDIKEISFYTHLLIKQMANKAASIISSL